MAKKKKAAIDSGTQKRKLTFVATVTTSANAVHLFLNGDEMDLEQDGDTWSGKKPQNVGESVQVTFNVNGFQGTDWAVSLAVKCPKDSPKIVDESGTIGEPDGHGFSQTKQILADPCAAKE